MSNLDFRPATGQDLPGILETMRLALGETPLLRRTPELWHWKHTHNPFGRSISLVAESKDGTIAGVRAFMRWSLETMGGQTLRCVRPVDTATHPAFVRQGIFRTLTMSAIEAARHNGVDLVFNTPNAKSAQGYLRMGWRQVGWIGAQVRVRLKGAVEADPEKQPTIDRLAPGALPPSGIPTPEPPTLNRNVMRTPRHSEYLEWRFSRHPYASYGWIPGKNDNGLVVRASERKGRTELVAADLLGKPDATPVTAAARESRARYLAGWFSPGTEKRHAAVRGGMLPVPGLKTLRLIALPLAELPCDPFVLGSWDLSTSDLELL